MADAIQPVKETDAVGADTLEQLGERLGRTLAGLGRSIPSGKGGNGGSAVERAETLVNGAEEQVAAYGTLAWMQLRRLLARAREQAEDVVAEARAVRPGTSEAEAE